MVVMCLVRGSRNSMKFEQVDQTTWTRLERLQF